MMMAGRVTVKFKRLKFSQRTCRILPTPLLVCVGLWDARGPLFTRHPGQEKPIGVDGIDFLLACGFQIIVLIAHAMTRIHMTGRHDIMPEQQDGQAQEVRTVNRPCAG